MRLIETAPVPELEALVREEARSFDPALTDAGVAHHFDDYGCGIHNYPHFERGLGGFWPSLVAAISL